MTEPANSPTELSAEASPQAAETPAKKSAASRRPIAKKSTPRAKAQPKSATKTSATKTPTPAQEKSAEEISDQQETKLAVKPAKKTPVKAAPKNSPKAPTKVAAVRASTRAKTSVASKSKSVPSTKSPTGAETKAQAKTSSSSTQRRTGHSLSVRAQAMRKHDLAIRVTGLAKSYEENHAVDTISFDVPKGKIYGIVGPNGAGKTTTMMMMAGLLRPDQGRITINDFDVWTDPDESKSLMGIMPDRFVLFDRLNGWQMLYYTGMLRGMKDKEVKARSAELVSLFGLESAANRLVHDYSAGMVKKLSLACAMMHSPEVLILDEPFESVDPVSTAALIRILRQQAEQGVTVVLSSHNMDLVNRTCDFLAIIVDGRVLDHGDIADVLQGKSLEERFRDLVGANTPVGPA